MQPLAAEIPLYIADLICFMGDVDGDVLSDTLLTYKGTFQIVSTAESSGDKGK